MFLPRFTSFLCHIEKDMPHSFCHMCQKSTQLPRMNTHHPLFSSRPIITTHPTVGYLYIVAWYLVSPFIFFLLIFFLGRKSKKQIPRNEQNHLHMHHLKYYNHDQLKHWCILPDDNHTAQNTFSPTTQGRKSKRKQKYSPCFTCKYSNNKVRLLCVPPTHTPRPFVLQQHSVAV